MKRAFLSFLAIFLFGTMVLGQNNNVVIYSQDGLKFTLILNGVRQNAQPETNVKVTGLNNATYQAKVIFANGISDIDQNLYLMNGGSPVQNTEFTSAIINKKGTYKLQFRGTAPIETVVTANPEQTVINYNPAGYGAATTVTTNTVGTTTTNTTGSGTVGVNVGVPGVNINLNVNDPNYVGSSTTTTTTTVTTSSSSPEPHVDHNHHSHNNAPYALPGYNGVYGCPAPMSPEDFEAAKKSIADKGFDESRLTIAKQIISSNCMLCKQIKELMELMSFESTKLDLAKYAWNHNLDKGNYYTLNDAFGFESSIEELNQYTQSH
ncbi:MAG: hypothetical protein JWP12_2582 [Bacteroidetes bacterium]|nr:hypothetical protein [Bacteroidota bacterium]